MVTVAFLLLTMSILIKNANPQDCKFLTTHDDGLATISLNPLTFTQLYTYEDDREGRPTALAFNPEDGRLWAILRDGYVDGVEYNSVLQEVDPLSGAYLCAGKVIANYKYINSLAFINGVAYAGVYDDGLHTLDVETGILTLQGEIIDIDTQDSVYPPAGLAYDPVNDLLYGTPAQGSDSDLLLINYKSADGSTVDAEIIGNTGIASISSLTFGPNGILYGGQTYDDSYLYSINTQTAVATRVENTEADDYLRGLTYFCRPDSTVCDELDETCPECTCNADCFHNMGIIEWYAVYRNVSSTTGCCDLCNANNEKCLSWMYLSSCADNNDCFIGGDCFLYDIKLENCIEHSSAASGTSPNGSCIYIDSDSYDSDGDSSDRGSYSADAAISDLSNMQQEGEAKEKGEDFKQYNLVVNLSMNTMENLWIMFLVIMAFMAFIIFWYCYHKNKNSTKERFVRGHKLPNL